MQKSNSALKVSYGPFLLADIVVLTLMLRLSFSSERSEKLLGLLRAQHCYLLLIERAAVFEGSFAVVSVIATRIKPGEFVGRGQIPISDT